MKNKGQITIFVIVALVIVVAVVFIFFINRGEVTSREQNYDNPESYVDNCLRDRTSLVIEEMFAGGGFIDANNTILYQGKEITYLCKNVNNFEPCINQYPVYLTQIKKELEREIQDDVEQCFASVKGEFIRKNYKFESGNIGVDVQLKPSIVEIVISSKVSISKGDFSKTFSRFETFVPSSIYEIGVIANEIVSQEAQWCHFSNDGFMILYPEYDIRVTMLDDSTKIYTIKDKKTQDKLMMATRGCALPAGLF